jgi:hypothetical protein
VLLLSVWVNELGRLRWSTVDYIARLFEIRGGHYA